MFISKYTTLPVQIEISSLICAGIIGLICDSSFITFGGDMEKIWKLALDPYKFPPIVQMYLKYCLTAIVIIKTFTIHSTLAMYVVTLWPAVFAEHPNLIIPWLAVGTSRCIVNSLSLVAGLYVCSAYGILNGLWIEFLFVEILEHGPFFYIWLSLLKYYTYLARIGVMYNSLLEKEQFELKNRRKSREKLMWQSKYFKNLAEKDRNLESQSTMESFVYHMDQQHKRFKRSLDSLLDNFSKETERKDVSHLVIFKEKKVSTETIKNLGEDNNAEIKARNLLKKFSKDPFKIEKKLHISEGVSVGRIHSPIKQSNKFKHKLDQYMDEVYGMEIELKNIDLS